MILFQWFELEKGVFFFRVFLHPIWILRNNLLSLLFCLLCWCVKGEGFVVAGG